MSFIKVNGVNLFYEIFAKQELPSDAGYLIILHGGPGVSDHSLYFDFWSQFSDKVHVVFFDMRGHGQSDKGDAKDWNLEQWGKDVFELCQALNIKNPIVAGVSFGGWIALSYALQYPQHPSKLILCNTEACIDNQAQIEIYSKKGGVSAGEVIRKIYESADPELWGEYIKYCAPHMSKNPYTENEIKKIKPNMRLYHNFYQTEQHRFNYLPQLSKLKLDTLILGGTDDPEHPLQSTLAMKDALVHAKIQLEVMDGAGDPVYRDFPNECKRIIDNFVNNS
jgi:pimeloyl-ACP methyl ester carboxylesterase